MEVSQGKRLDSGGNRGSRAEGWTRRVCPIRWKKVHGEGQTRERLAQPHDLQFRKLGDLVRGPSIRTKSQASPMTRPELAASLTLGCTEGSGRVRLRIWQDGPTHEDLPKSLTGNPSQMAIVGTTSGCSRLAHAHVGYLYWRPARVLVSWRMSDPRPKPQPKAGLTATLSMVRCQIDTASRLGTVSRAAPNR